MYDTLEYRRGGRMSLRDELQKSRMTQHLFTLSSYFDKLAISPSQAPVHGKGHRSNWMSSFLALMSRWLR